MDLARHLSQEQLHLLLLRDEAHMALPGSHIALPRALEDVQQTLERLYRLHQDLEQRFALLESSFTRQDDMEERRPVRRPDERRRLAGEPEVNRNTGYHDDMPEPGSAARPHPGAGTASSGPASPRHELKNRFLYDLLHGRINDDQSILRDARILGLDFAPPRTVILIDAADYILAADSGEAADAQIRQRAQAIISNVVDFFYLPNETICAYLGDGEVAVLKASDTRNLAGWVDRRDSSERIATAWANLPALRRASNALLEHLRRTTSASINIGVGRYHAGVTALARSYQDARAALSLGRRFCGRNGVYSLDNLGIAAFIGVSDEATKVDLANHLLSPLNGETELLETLTVFFAENCCPSATAARISIHRNTLGYRLDKITALIGLNPRRFDDGVQIRLALALRAFGVGAAPEAQD